MMRTPRPLMALIVLLLLLPASAASARPDTSASLRGLRASVLLKTFSQTLVSRVESLESELERRDQRARYERILARRGTAPRATASRSGKPGLAATREFSLEQHHSGPVDALIVTTIEQFNPTVTTAQARSLAALIQSTAERYQVDPLLVTALVSQESAFHQSAVSPVGATGLGQLMPETAQELGVNPHDPAQNLDGSVRYLADLLYYWSGSPNSTTLALASYNAGAGNVERYGGVPPFEETQNYVVVIQDRYATLSAGQAIFRG
jgi:membrane-bound lytic murein transglycosylase B